MEQCRKDKNMRRCQRFSFPLCILKPLKIYSFSSPFGVVRGCYGWSLKAWDGKTSETEIPALAQCCLAAKQESNQSRSSQAQVSRFLCWDADSKFPVPRSPSLTYTGRNYSSCLACNFSFLQKGKPVTWREISVPWFGFISSLGHCCHITQTLG